MQNHCTVQVQKDAESLHSPSTEGCRITAQSKHRRVQNHCTVQVQKDAESLHSPSTEGCRITAQSKHRRVQNHCTEECRITAQSKHVKLCLAYDSASFFSYMYVNNINMPIFRTSLFCDITQQVVVISYQCFGTIYWSHFLASRIQKKTSCPNTRFI